MWKRKGQLKLVCIKSWFNILFSLNNFMQSLVKPSNSSIKDIPTNTLFKKKFPYNFELSYLLVLYSQFTFRKYFLYMFWMNSYLYNYIFRRIQINMNIIYPIYPALRNHTFKNLQLQDSVFYHVKNILFIYFFSLYQ